MALQTATEVSGEVTLKTGTGRGEVVANMQVVARVSRPLNGQGSGGQIIEAGQVIVIDEKVSTANGGGGGGGTAVAAGTITPAMVKVAKKFRLQPEWLLDPCAPVLMESNAALDSERTKLDELIHPFVVAGRPPPPALEAKLTQVNQKMLLNSKLLFQSQQMESQLMWRG